MTFIIASVVVALSTIFFSFTVSNIILILFFAIPFTNKLEHTSLLKPNKHIVASYILALFFQLIITSVVVALFYVFFADSYFISLLVGFTFATIGTVTNISRFGLSFDNFSDYFEKNKDCFWEELVDHYNKDKNNLFNFIISEINKR